MVAVLLLPDGPVSYPALPPQPDMAALKRMITGIPGHFQPGTFGYSLAFGAVAGTALGGVEYGSRHMSVMLWDTEREKLQSRLRYLEKQVVFNKEQEAEGKAHYLASLAQEYNPVATAMPFSKLDDAMRL
eukprot:CAMPEP_0204312220 /NCGR_PEP_ID=MMETSP0469-20131031/2846_1 /ASSEMBLY_ACC=CAM_ASM_000384 /TAXON_ID=2969 /ORGANISM="Oxyrrhis marina" /LENGTH=129 /DNA_ID=CAMNT_0051292327 /DNA_START=32 /DNA_END=421 /DNA_ORIENTATION=+